MSCALNTRNTRNITYVNLYVCIYDHNIVKTVVLFIILCIKYCGFLLMYIFISMNGFVDIKEEMLVELILSNY